MVPLSICPNRSRPNHTFQIVSLIGSSPIDQPASALEMKIHCPRRLMQPALVTRNTRMPG
jgi:hypothetical protein